MAVDGLIGRKVGMTQLYGADGRLVPVTVVQLGPCTVVGVRQPERDGYRAVQIGFEPLKAERVGKALRGQFAKAGTGVFRIVREVGLRSDDAPALGSAIAVGDLFQAGQTVDVVGTSKGRGTAGVIKRHGFSGFPGSHGTHEYFRHGGSIGNRSYPGRVFKGKRMAGRMGAERVTVRNVAVFGVRPDENLILLQGAIPGGRNGMIMVRRPSQAVRA